MFKFCQKGRRNAAFNNHKQRKRLYEKSAKRDAKFTVGKPARYQSLLGIAAFVKFTFLANGATNAYCCGCPALLYSALNHRLPPWFLCSFETPVK